MKNANYPTFTAKEKEAIENLDRGTSDKHFGQLQVKNVIRQRYAFLNELRKETGNKYCGSLQMKDENGKSFWYFKAIDGETYRIPEPENGIDEYFEIEFKRKDL